jgi:hypothetical protein
MLPLTVKLRAIDQAHSTVSWSAEDELGPSPPPEINIVPGRSATSPRSSHRIDRGGSGVHPRLSTTKEVGKVKRALMRMLKMMMGKDGKSST